MRLMIAIPCGDTVRYEFAESLSKLQLRLSEDGIDYDVRWLAGSLIVSAREDLASKAVEDGYTHILWLDSDMQFTGDLFSLLRSVDKPFVTGIYRSRRSPYAICLYADLERGQRVLKLPDEPFRVDACGFGCVLMETRVIKTVRSKYGCCFLPTLASSEDIALCERWTKMNGEIWAVPDARCNHICYVPLRCDDPARLVEYKEQR